MTDPRKALVATLLSATLAFPALAADSLFPDPELEKVVRQSVFAKRNTTEPLTADDVKDLSQVVARAKGVRDLRGLEHCKKLMLLDLHDNQVADLGPLKDLDLLQSLTLSRNQVADLGPVGKLTRLSSLNAAGNRIVDLSPLKALNSLNRLDISNNRVTDLGPLVEMAQADIGGSERFARYWTVNVAGNPLGEKAKNEQAAKLGEWSARIQVAAGQKVE